MGKKKVTRSAVALQPTETSNTQARLKELEKENERLRAIVDAFILGAQEKVRPVILLAQKLLERFRTGSEGDIEEPDLREMVAQGLSRAMGFALYFLDSWYRVAADVDYWLKRDPGHIDRNLTEWNLAHTEAKGKGGQS